MSTESDKTQEEVLRSQEPSISGENVSKTQSVGSSDTTSPSPNEQITHEFVTPADNIVVLPFYMRIGLSIRKFYELHWPELLGALLAALIAIGLAIIIAYLSFPYPQVQCTVKEVTPWSEWSVCLPCGFGKGTKFRNRTITFSSDTKNTSCIQTNQTIKCNVGPCCDDGFVSDSYLLNCFKVMPIIRTWYSARTLAGQLNGDLAVIDFRQKHEFLVKAAIQVIKVENVNFHLNRKFWIGLRCPNTDTISGCMWTNGDNVTFTKFANPFLRRHFDLKFVQIHCTYLDLTNLSNPVWANDRCDSQYRFIVEQNSSVVSNCTKYHTNITNYSINYCYRVVNQLLTWQQAQSHGLVTINSPAEQSYIMSLIKETPPSLFEFWIGFRCFDDAFLPSFGCVVRDRCRWIDGTGLTYNNHSHLFQYYKNCSKHNTGCLTISRQGDWNFKNCTKNLPYIIEEQPLCDKLSGSSWSEWSDCIVLIGNNSLKHLCGAGTRTRTIGYNLTGEACPNPTSYNISHQQCHVTCQKECKNFYLRSGLNFCYKFENEKKSFEELMKTETQLITIETLEEFDYVINQFIHNHTGRIRIPYYIGLICDRDDDYRFCRWINSQRAPLNFNKFAFGHPRVPNEDFRCVAIYRQTALRYAWISVNCSQAHGYIEETRPKICYKFNYFSNVKFVKSACNRQSWIEKSTALDHLKCPTVANEKERLCPTNEACKSLSSLNFQYCFDTISISVTFAQFESIRSDQNSLVVIDGKQKQHFLIDLLLRAQMQMNKNDKDQEKKGHLCAIHGRYFIGLQCYDTGVIDECVWLPLNKPIKEIPNKYHNFAPGQPDMGPNPDVFPHFCVVMNSTKLDGTWYSVPCNLTSCFLVEFGPQCDKFAIDEWKNVTYKCALMQRNGLVVINPNRCINCGLQLLHYDSHTNCPTSPLKLNTEFKGECCSHSHYHKYPSDRYSPWCHVYLNIHALPKILVSCNVSIAGDDGPSLAIVDTFHEWYSMVTRYKYNYYTSNNIIYPVWTAGYCEPNGTCFWKIQPCLPEFTFPADDYAFWEGGGKPQIHKRMCAAILNNKSLLTLVDCKQKPNFYHLGSFIKTIPIVNRIATETLLPYARSPEQFIMPYFFTRRHDCSYYDFERNRTCFNCPPWIEPKYKHNCFNCTDPDQHWKELRLNFSYCYKVTEDKLSMVDAESWYEFDGGPIVPRFLATIRSDEEKNYIKSLLPSNSDPHFIGIQCWNLDYGLTCFWRDATLLRYENFAVGEPDYFDVLNNKTRCAVLDVKLNGLWKSVPCNQSYHLVLERLPICNKFDPWLVVNLPGRGFMSSWKVSAKLNVSSISVANSQCPFVNKRVKPAGLPNVADCIELMKNADYCYWAGRDERSAFEREKRPLNYNWFVAFGRDLASIDNESEQTLLIKSLRYSLDTGQYLIGLYCVDDKAEDCKWTDGSTLAPQAFHLFQKGNPHKSLHCVVLNLPEQTWTSINCSQGVSNYILEYAPSCRKHYVGVRTLSCPACHNINCHHCKCGWNMTHPIGCINTYSPKFLGPCCQGVPINDTGVCAQLASIPQDWLTWKKKEEKEYYAGRLLVINDTAFTSFLKSFSHSQTVYTAGVCYNVSGQAICYGPGLKKIDSQLFGLNKITLILNKQPLCIKIGPNPKFVFGKFEDKRKALLSYRKYDSHVLPPFYDF